MSELSRISILFFLASSLSPSLLAQAQTQTPLTVTFLDEVKCQARWIPLANPEEIPIDQIHDRALPLAPGDQVRCISPGHLTLITDDQSKTVKSDDGPYTISAVPENEPKRQPLRQLIASAVAFHGIPAPADTKNQRVLFPVENQALRPGDFLIRWKPLSGSEKISFALSLASSPSPLWSSPQLDGATGLFQALEARKVLEAVRKKSPSAAVQLQLQPSVQNHPEDPVNFTLLSPDDEASLNSEIRQWDLMDSQLLQYLGRGYSYSTRNLFFDAAREYDRAVAQLGDSCRLLFLDRDANSRIGRSDHVDLLDKKISRIPDSCPALAPQLH
jgi:hypothetical protein